MLGQNPAYSIYEERSVHEVTVTGINTLTHPHLDIWSWLIAVYLFLGGLVGGLLILSAISQFRARGKEMPRSAYIGPVLAPFILSAAMAFVFLDLTKKLSVFWFYLSFMVTAPMSWVAWALGITIIMSTLWSLASIPERWRAQMESAGSRDVTTRSYVKRKLHLFSGIALGTIRKVSFRLLSGRDILAAVNLVLGIILGMGTGVLLSSFVARPLWNTPVLPVLFLVSGLSTGASLLILIEKDERESLFFKKADIVLITAEILLIALFFYGHLASTAAHREAIRPFLAGGYYFPFWTVTLIFGISLPLVIGIEVAEVTGHARSRLHIGAWLVLIVGLILRLSLVYAGQLTGLTPLTGS